MKRSFALFLVVLLIGSTLANAATVITLQQAKQNILIVVRVGTFTQALKQRELGKIIWAADIAGAVSEFEVWMDAHAGAILQVLTQPLGPQTGYISTFQAEQDALKAVGGGTVVQAQRDQRKGYQIWDRHDSAGFEHDVFVNARTGKGMAIIVGG